jgi:hypothetical protein
MLEFDDAPKGLARLIYASRAAKPAGTSSEQVRMILTKAIQHNRVAAITGVLVVGDGHFLQFLEGPADEVQVTFDRISRDPRHTDVVVIARGPAERRLFRDWNMAQHQVTATDHSLLAELGLTHFAPDTLDEAQALRVVTTIGARYLR